VSCGETFTTAEALPHPAELGRQLLNAAYCAVTGATSAWQLRELMHVLFPGVSLAELITYLVTAPLVLNGRRRKRF
jgi:hypothetical protein